MIILEYRGIITNPLKDDCGQNLIFHFILWDFTDPSEGLSIYPIHIEIWFVNNFTLICMVRFYNVLIIKIVRKITIFLTQNKDTYFPWFEGCRLLDWYDPIDHPRPGLGWYRSCMNSNCWINWYIFSKGCYDENNKYVLLIILSGILDKR